MTDELNALGTDRRSEPTDDVDVQTYIVDAIIGFLNDPPDSAFQRGYQAALRTVYLDVWGTSKMRAADARGELDWNEVMRSTS